MTKQKIKELLLHWEPKRNQKMKERALSMFRALLRFQRSLMLPAHQRYHVTRVIGRGAFGLVALALCQDKQRYAIKWVRCFNSLKNESMALVLVAKHPSFVQLKDFVQCRDETLLVLELCDVNLLQHMSRKQRLPETEIRSFMTDLLKGLVFLHDEVGMIHRDLKPGNLLLQTSTTPPRLKIADFGTMCSKARGSGSATCVYGTYTYSAPELFLGMVDYDERIDLWSAGITLVNLITCQDAFTQSSSNTQWETLICMFRVLGTPTEASWPGVTRLPLFMPELPRFPHKPLEVSYVVYSKDELVPTWLDPVLLGLLEPCPAKRFTAAEALLLL
jgi:serine/threonine protein kinase